MKTLYKIFSIFIISTVIAQCDPCLGMLGDCAESFNFRIIDKATREDIVFGQNPTYNHDSVYLFTTLPGYTGRFSSVSNNKFSSFLSIPVDTFYLYLNSADTDTLLMKYDFVKSRCCKAGHGYGKILEIKLNGIVAKKQGDIFVLEK